MDNNINNSKTIKVGDVDITININHHGETQSSGGTVQPAPEPANRSKPRRRDKLNIFLIVVICFCVISIIACFWSYSSFTPSTHDRRVLAAGTAIDKGYYTDKAGLIDDESVLLKGLKAFYKTTGVQPYLYITNTIDGVDSPTDQQLKSYADSRYHELFSDEAHLLVVLYISGGSFIDSYAYGTQAAGVIDSEAEHIIHDYLGYNFSFDSYTNSKALSKAFSDAAEHIMIVTLNPWIVLLICGPASAIVAVLYIRRRKKQRAANDDLSAQEVEKLLSIPLEKFGDLEAEELAKKYEDKT